MPQIPTAGPVAETQYGQMSPGAAAAPYEQVERSAAQLGQIAQVGLQVAQYVQRAQDHVATLKFENEFNAELHDRAENHKLDTDYETMPDRVQKEIEDMKQKYQETYSGNPRIWAAIQNHMDTRLEEYQGVMTDKAIGLLRQDNTFELYKARDEAHQQIALTGDPTKKAILANEFFGKVKASVANGLLSKEDGYKLTENFAVADEETEIANSVNSQDSKTLENIVNRIGSPGEFPEMTAKKPKELSNYKYRAEQRLKEIQEKEQKKLDATAGDSTIGWIDHHYRAEDGSMDYSFVEKQLHNPEFQAAHGLIDAQGNPNRKVIEEVSAFYKAEQSESDKDDKEAAKKEDTQVTDLFTKGKFVDVIKATRNPDSKMTPELRRTLFEAATRMQKHSEDDISPEQEAEAYLKLTDRIAQGDSPRDIEAAILKERNLKFATKRELIDRVRKDEKPEFKDSLRLADQTLKEQIAPGADQLTIGLDEEKINVLKEQRTRATHAQQALHAYFDNEQKKVDAGRRPQITRQEIQDFADSLIPLNQIDFDRIVAASTDINAPREKTVYMVSPDGKDEMNIPESRVDHYKKLGAKVKEDGR
jgi:hypothetical protein